MSVEARATESTKPCEGCDLDEIDALTCKAKEIQKKAEVTTESLQTLDARRADFKAAKDAYTAAWAAAKADVDAATAKLTPLKKELACRLSDQKRQCLARSGRRSRPRSTNAQASKAVVVSIATSTSQPPRLIRRQLCRGGSLNYDRRP